MSPRRAESRPAFAKFDFPSVLDRPVDPGWDLGVAAQYTVLSRFRKLLGYRVAVWRDEDPEAVHRIRVAARRTRTALRAFGAIWDEAAVESFSRALAKLARRMGPARDLDVLVEHARGRMRGADAERAGAYRWLLARLSDRRAAERPSLRRALGRFEVSGIPAAFVTYFASNPVDLWTFEEAAADGPA